MSFRYPLYKLSDIGEIQQKRGHRGNIKEALIVLNYLDKNTRKSFYLDILMLPCETIKTLKQHLRTKLLSDIKDAEILEELKSDIEDFENFRSNYTENEADLIFEVCENSFDLDEPPSWTFDNITPRQYVRLCQYGKQVDNLTKGEASVIITLIEHFKEKRIFDDNTINKTIVIQVLKGALYFEEDVDFFEYCLEPNIKDSFHKDLNNIYEHPNRLKDFINRQKYLLTKSPEELDRELLQTLEQYETTQLTYFKNVEEYDEEFSTAKATRALKSSINKLKKWLKLGTSNKQNTSQKAQKRWNFNKPIELQETPKFIENNIISQSPIIPIGNTLQKLTIQPIKSNAQKPTIVKNENKTYLKFAENLKKRKLQIHTPEKKTIPNTEKKKIIILGVLIVLLIPIIILNCIYTTY